MPISQARKRILTIYDFIVQRLAAGGWDNVHVISNDRGWPEDKNLVILGQGQTLKDGQVPVPCLKLMWNDLRDDGDIQIGGGVGEDVELFQIFFQCRTVGEETDLRFFLHKSFSDSIVWLLDWTQYPQSPSPTPLHRMDISNVASTPIVDADNDNPALRYGGLIRFNVTDQRTREIVTNI